MYKHTEREQRGSRAKLCMYVTLAKNEKELMQNEKTTAKEISKTKNFKKDAK